MSEPRTLEELLEAGMVESALLLRGDFTPAELDLIRQAYGYGVDAGKAARAGALEELLAAAEARIPERGQGYDYPDLADGEPLKHGIISAQYVADACRKALGKETT